MICDYIYLCNMHKQQSRQFMCLCKHKNVTIHGLIMALALAEASGGERAWSLGEAYAPEALQAEEEDADVIPV